MFHIRPVRVDDGQEWLAMRLDLWPDGAESHASEISTFLAGNATNPLQVLIAIDDAGSALGFVELSIRRYVDGCETDRVAYLEGWYVKPEHRRRGVGRALIDAAEAWGRAQGSTEFGSDALLGNASSAAAHRALGFEETEQVRYFRKAIGHDVQPRAEESVLQAFLKLVAGRRGHFLLESGYHGSVWLDLEPLFADAARVDPFVALLAAALRPHRIDAVYGPHLGGAFLAQLVARLMGVEFGFTERTMPAHVNGLFQAHYRLPRGYAERLSGRRVAIVDDVISAGSAVRGTYATLIENGAIPVVVGALMVLGSTGASFFEDRGIPVEAAARDEYELWEPSRCPLCANGVPLESPAGLS